jgi:cytochrome d ubiquinol oxidase subunit II
MAATAVAAIWVIWGELASYTRQSWTWGAVGLAAVALILAVVTSLSRRNGLAFTFSSVGLLAAVVWIFGALYPNVSNASKVTVANQGTADALNAALPNLVPEVIPADPGLIAGADITSLVTTGFEGAIPVITGLPIHAAASSEQTLKLMTIVACCLVPFVLAYQAWNIWVFRRRLTAEIIPVENGLAPV